MSLICSIQNSTCPGQFSPLSAQNALALASRQIFSTLTVVFLLNRILHSYYLVVWFVSIDMMPLFVSHAHSICWIHIWCPEWSNVSQIALVFRKIQLNRYLRFLGPAKAYLKIKGQKELRKKHINLDIRCDDCWWPRTFWCHYIGSQSDSLCWGRSQYFPLNYENNTIMFFYLIIPGS